MRLFAWILPSNFKISILFLIGSWLFVYSDSGILTQKKIGSPVIGIAKGVLITGNRDITFFFYIENLGDEDLHGLSLADNLNNVFGAGNYAMTEAPSFNVNPGGIVLNPAFNGSSVTSIIGSGTLAVGARAEIQFSVQLTQASNQDLSNQVTCYAIGSEGTPVSDVSDHGSDPDPNGDGNPGGPGEDDPTVFNVTDKAVGGIAKTASIAGSHVVFDFFIENLGDLDLFNLSVPDDLNAVFGSANFLVDNPPTWVGSHGNLLLNSNFDGDSQTELISSGTLEVGATVHFQVGVMVTSNTGPYSNQVVLTASSLTKTVAPDLSDNGTDPDPNGNGYPGDSGENDPTQFSLNEQPLIGISKTAVVLDNRVTFNFFLENLGQTDLQNLGLLENLDLVFGSGNYLVLGSPLLIDDPGSLTLNGGFDGHASIGLISSGTLAQGDTAQIQVNVLNTNRSDQGLGLGNYQNQVEITAQSPFGGLTSDLSTPGTNPDPDHNGIPDESGFTTFSIEAFPVIGVSKTATLQGTMVRFDLFLENLGNVSVGNLSIEENLNDVFGSGAYQLIGSPELVDSPETVMADNDFDGDNQIEILQTSSSLAPRSICQIRCLVKVLEVRDQGQGLGNYQNQVLATGLYNAIPVQDVSTDGSDPDPNSNGNPGDAGEDQPTLFTMPAQPMIGGALNVLVAGRNALVDLYLVTYGNMPLEALSLPLNLDDVFGAGNYTLFATPSLLEGPGTFSLNPGWNGISSLELIQTGSTTSPGDRVHIQFQAQIQTLADLGFGLGNYSMQFEVSALDSLANPASDLSDEGTNPDLSANQDPTEAGENDPTLFSIRNNSILGIAKNAQVNGVAVTFDLYLDNPGTETIDTLGIDEDLDLVFGAGNYTMATFPLFVSDPGSLTLNPSFNGQTDTQLLDPVSSLAGGQSAQIRFLVTVNSIVNLGLGYGVYKNQVLFQGLDPDNISISDLSHNGILSDPNGNGVPTEPTEKDSTPVFVGSFISGSVWMDDNGNGTMDGGETGIDAVTLSLFEDSNLNGSIDPLEPEVASSVTDPSGLFMFQNLESGIFLLKVTDELGLLQNATLTGGQDPFPIDLAEGGTLTGIDFGFCSSPVFDTQPVGSSHCEGQGKTFSVAVSSESLVSYQWYKNGELLPGEELETLELLDLSVYDSGSYTCIATNLCGSMESTPALLVVQSFFAEISPGAQAQGLNFLVFHLNLDCETPPVNWSWQLLPDGPDFGFDESPVTLTEMPLVTTQIEVLAIDDTLNSASDTALILVSLNPDFLDYNFDGCNNLQDLWDASQFWGQAVPDADGNGIMNILDYIFINLDDAAPCD